MWLAAWCVCLKCTTPFTDDKDESESARQEYSGAAKVYSGQDNCNSFAVYWSMHVGD